MYIQDKFIAHYPHYNYSPMLFNYCSILLLYDKIYPLILRFNLEIKMPRKRKISQAQKAAYITWITVRKKQIDELATLIKNNKKLIVEFRKQIKGNRRSIASLDAWVARDRARVANLQNKIVQIKKRMK